MTSNRQVSSAIRISQGEKDVSARATHLEAATRKFLVATNERKYMSIKTNFKRIALVAVAALGMSFLSSAPSQAVIVTSNITLTGTAGTATLTQSDSRTGATIALTFLGTAVTDTIVVTVAAKAKPSAATTYPTGYLSVSDTGTSVGAGNVFGMGRTNTGSGSADPVRIDSLSAAGRALSTIPNDSYTSVKMISGDNTYNTINLKLHMGLTSSDTLKAGTYTYTVTATPNRATGGDQGADAKSVDVNIVITAPDSTPVAANSTAVLSSAATTYAAPTPGGDSTVSVAATASSTSKAVIRVTLKNVDGDSTPYVEESVTAVTTVGSLGTSSTAAIGKSLTMQYVKATGYLDIFVFADGTAGTGTITITTPSVSFTSKSVSFYNTTMSTLTAVQGANVISVGSNSASTATGLGPIWGLAKDSLGNTVIANAAGGSGVYAYSANTAIISDSGTACTYTASVGYHSCSLTGVAAGTTTVTLRSLGTGNLTGAVLSAPITVRVGSTNPAKLQMAFDKATYAPGERAFLKIWAVDAAGNVVSPRTIPGLMASGGVTSTSAFSNSTVLPTATEYAIAHYVKALSPTNYTDSKDPVYIAALNMPVNGGKVTVTATGGAALPASGQVAVTATAEVTDVAASNAAAALAAVTALAATVASLRTLITTLTNLVLKIQKKVKA